MLRSLFQSTPGNADSPATDDPSDRPYRIAAAPAADVIEIEDESGLRQHVALSYGAQEMIGKTLRSHRLESPVGLRVSRERFVVEDTEFWRWRVLPPTETAPAA